MVCRTQQVKPTSYSRPHRFGIILAGISQRTKGGFSHENFFSTHVLTYIHTYLLLIRAKDIGFQQQFFNFAHAYYQHYWIWHRIIISISTTFYPKRFKLRPKLYILSTPLLLASGIHNGLWLQQNIKSWHISFTLTFHCFILKYILNCIENSGSTSIFVYFCFFLIYKVICQKPNHFLHVAMLISSLEVLTVLGMYHFGYFLPKKVQTKARHADKSNIIVVSLLDRLPQLDKKKRVWHAL